MPSWTLVPKRAIRLPPGIPTAEHEKLGLCLERSMVPSPRLHVKRDPLLLMWRPAQGNLGGTIERKATGWVEEEEGRLVEDGWRIECDPLRGFDAPLVEDGEGQAIPPRGRWSEDPVEASRVSRVADCVAHLTIPSSEFVLGEPLGGTGVGVVEPQYVFKPDTYEGIPEPPISGLRPHLEFRESAVQGTRRVEDRKSSRAVVPAARFMAVLRGEGLGEAAIVSTVIPAGDRRNARCSEGQPHGARPDGPG